MPLVVTLACQEDSVADTNVAVAMTDVYVAVMTATSVSAVMGTCAVVMTESAINVAQIGDATSRSITHTDVTSRMTCVEDDHP